MKDAAIKPLEFRGFGGWMRADAFGCSFIVAPTLNSNGYRYVIRRSAATKKWYWRHAPTQEQAFEACNRQWQSMLAPYVHVAKECV